MKRRKTARTLAFALLAALAMTATAYVSASGRWRLQPGRLGKPAEMGRDRRFRRLVQLLPGFFTSDRREAGGSGWNTDYPGSDNNFFRPAGGVDTRSRQA
jgi:hypothetical protein